MGHRIDWAHDPTKPSLLHVYHFPGIRASDQAAHTSVRIENCLLLHLQLAGWLENTWKAEGATCPQLPLAHILLARVGPSEPFESRWSHIPGFPPSGCIRVLKGDKQQTVKLALGAVLRMWRLPQYMRPASSPVHSGAAELSVVGPGSGSCRPCLHRATVRGSFFRSGGRSAWLVWW